jgi:hypothetical protein
VSENSLIFVICAFHLPLELRTIHTTTECCNMTTRFTVVIFSILLSR